ncbi:hypothetical protein JF66_15500 [Cryobacterium sp. MLB-32]|uniref:RDD family protein n=1 Tax=Cryobacterium sp. MLB-32 TaxID=1529318 RepID=UPI0004E69A8E|nr:RDD family protein [Cryobacterium sp. MLB-32]KFF58855.1 hypothetical protein JF66_15500 [Cryobacterium sp. MLB-32]
MTQTSSAQLTDSGAAPASLAGRAAACLLDLLWVLAPTLVIFLILFGVAAEAAGAGDATRAVGLLLAAWLGAGVLGVFSFVCWAALLGRGRTPGLNAVGLQLVRITEGGSMDAPGIARAVVRAVVFVLGACIVVGPFSPLFDRTGAGRGWHDRASGTRVAVARTDARARETENDTWLPVERLAPPRARGWATAPAPSKASVPSAAFAPSDSAAALHAFVPVGRATYTAPLKVATRYPFTRAPIDVDDLDRTRSADAVPLSSTHGTVRWLLRLDTGEAFDVHGDGLIGRNPVALDGLPCQLIGYADTTMSISKTHLSFGLEDGRLWMTDRRSTNGSSLIRAGSEQRPISSVARTFVEPGDLIALGERRIWVAAR